MIDEMLNFLGLDSKESIIYSQLCTLGTCSAKELSRNLEIPKTTVLEKLYSLVDKALVSKSLNKNKILFTPEDPEILNFKIQKKAIELQYFQKHSSEAILALKNRKAKSKIPQIKYFTSLEGIKQLYLDTLTSKTEILAHGNFPEEVKYLEEFMNEYWQKRATNGIFLTGLIPDTQIGKGWSNSTNKQHLRKTYLYQTQDNPALEIDIYDDKVNIISFTELLGIQIQSQAIADSLRTLHNLATKDLPSID
jgi:sugar-specific transcriptional regulator TrmB